MKRAHSVAELLAADAHVFIEASAGSGKTTRLTELMVQAIETRNVRIDEILCVTFTEKAASELKARVYERLVGSRAKACRAAVANFSRNAIGTIHNFCLKSLKLDPTYDLTEDMETALLADDDLFEEAREIVYRTHWDELPEDKLSEYLVAVDFGKGGGGSDRDFDRMLKLKATYAFALPEPVWGKVVEDARQIEGADDFVYFTLQRIVAQMRRIASGKNAMTFSRMVSAMAQAVRNPELAAKIRSLYKYALIDEFQDTDPAQWQIFRTLFLSETAGPKLIVVGDPKQAIYKFRGADVFVYLEARRELANAGAVMDHLPVNYRSAPEILAALDSVFTATLAVDTWSRAGIDYTPPAYGGKTLSTGEDTTGVEFFTTTEYDARNSLMFAELAAVRIGQIREAHPDWTIAVVAYKHQTLRNFAEVFRRLRIDFSYYRQQPDYRRLENEHFKVLLESFLFPEAQGYAMAHNTIFARAQASSRNWYSTLARYITENRIVAFLQTIAQDWSPLHLALAADGDADAYHSWRLYCRQLLSLCGKKIFDLETLRRCVHDIATGKDTQDSGYGDILRCEGAVTLITVQSAKGLDWNMVVVADGINDRQWKNYPFFHDARGRGIIVADESLFDRGTDKLLSTEEESRIMQLNLLYVALTRAKHKLVGYIAASFREKEAGPVAVFLTDWLYYGRPQKSGVALTELKAAYEATDYRQPPRVETEKPAPIEHGDIPLRITERTSFTALSGAEFTETDYIEDILPRGSETGELLHSFLETCDFRQLASIADEGAAGLRDQIMAEVRATYPAEETNAAAIAARIARIFEATATAALPLSGSDRKITLAELKPGNLWREMPFWGTAAIHSVLTPKEGGLAVRRTMHGFMDLVFTPDEVDYYILDYKSNSLSEIDPAVLDAYTREHYALQARIYAEALDAYLRENYGAAKRVAGCYFLFLRYLKTGATTGVHFTDFGVKK